MFRWDNKSINWFKKSAENTLFHKTIANEIVKFIEKDSSLLSLGSGLGYLERELSPYFKEITLVDTSKDATIFLEKNKTDNQIIINEDFKNINKKADYLLLSFFSRMYINDNLEDFLKLTNKKIFYLVNQRHSDEKEIIKYLISKGVNFTYKHMRLNFNQILKKEELNDYLNHYYSNATTEKRARLLKQVRKIDNNNIIFENNKKIILFIIDRGEEN